MRSGLLMGPGLLMGSGLFIFGACEEEYPLEPTFCDDWCRAIRVDCDDEPNECVTDCELTRSSEDCFHLQEQLLKCYEENPESIVCVGEGFRAEARVEGGACRAERDALFDCEAPGIGSCLQLCRVEQQEQLQAITESPTSVPENESKLDAGIEDGCPALQESCETICWTLFRFTSSGLTAAGVPEASNDPSGAGGPAIVEAVEDCYANRDE